jgi:hypothetical protein
LSLYPRPARWAAVTAAALSASALSVVTLAAPAHADVRAKSYTGSGTFVVPEGMTKVHVIAVGAPGGWAYQGLALGGRGARVEADLAVTGGDELTIHVGGTGASGGGGSNGGGTSGIWLSGGGGGASDVRLNGDDLADRVLVAAGGGGGHYGGEGPANGGDAGAGGTLLACPDGTAPTPGGLSAGGIGSRQGGACWMANGGDGSFGVGGNGAFDSGSNNGGGGGGGGWYGGGAGGPYSSGAGGSSYANPTITSDVSTTLSSATPVVQISYDRVGQGLGFSDSTPSTVEAGTTYDLLTEGGLSGNAVSFALGTVTGGSCTLSGATLTFAHPGSCRVSATVAGDDLYLDDSASTTFTVEPAATTTSLDVAADTLSAAVEIDGDATLTVTGSVRFLLGDEVVGTVPVTGGRAVLTRSAPASNQADDVHAEFLGTADLGPSADSATREERDAPSFDDETPTDAVVGTTAEVGVTPGDVGATVVLHAETEPGSSAICRVAGTTVTFDHVGSCDVSADQAGNWLWLPSDATTSIEVSPTDTTTTVTVRPTSLSATVTAEDPSTLTPVGNVRFLVDDVAVGTAALVGGTATLAYKVPTGDEHAVMAEYLGNADAVESADETYRDDPIITASLSSKLKKKAGWYRSPVKVSFECEEATDEVSCPATRVIATSGAKQVVRGTATALDGGSATATVRVSIDMIAPTLKVSGVKKGKTVKAKKRPKLRCVGSDKLSGLSSCTLKERVTRKAGKKTTIQYTAVATDKAGNTTKVVGTYVWAAKA